MQTQPWVFLGAAGRVGCLVTRHLCAASPVVPLFYQTRQLTADAQAQPAFFWAPLDGPQGLLDFVLHTGPIGGLMVFLGATPGQSADMSLNETLAEACLSAAHQAGIGRVLLASSSAVYGVGKGLPFLETDDLTPVNDYGLAKARMEEACQPWRDRGLEVCCLRIGNVAGADALLKHMGEEAPRQIEQYADGRGPQRSYIGPAMLGDVLISLAGHRGVLPPCLNIATPHPVGMTDLATAAGMAWDYVPANSQPQFQSITINCAALQALHHFASGDSRSDAIVRQLLDPT